MAIIRCRQEIKEKRLHNTEIHIYKGAGHIFSENIILYTKDIIMNIGVDEKANKKADQESKKIIDEKLKLWHK